MQKKKKLFLQEKKRYLKKIIGTIKKPRLSVFKSHKHIYAQLIDDKTGTTLAFSSTLDKKIASTTVSTATKPASFLVGQDLGEKAIKKQVTKVIFDRGIHPYHGRVQSLAEGARQEGLIF